MANEQISEITTVPTNATVIKIINDLIKRYNSLGNLYQYKGSVQTYDDLLAIQNPQIGDVYNVIQEDAEQGIAAGSNFAWNGTEWDNLGGSLAGLVQSVNGINPDSLGNVLLPLIKNITTNQGVLTITKNDDTTIQVDNIKKLYTVGLGQTVDLNNLVEAGIYICDNDSYAANYENCPIQKAFLLEVQATNNGNFIFQFLTQYNDGTSAAGNQYVRTYQATLGWSVWRMAGSDLNGYAQLNLANTFTALNVFRANIAVSNGTAAGSQGQIILGVKPNTATVQANIISSTTGALKYNATEATGHYFRIGNNTASTSITSNESETAIFSHNAFEFARITNVGVAKWLGNANTATKLETARTINGVSFDGTANITIADSTKLPIAGGTMTGDLTLKGNPTADLMAATKKYVDDSVASAGSGSNLTIYTSLEQIGITPGEETFASIHSALPINSVLEYYASEAQNFADIYPASYGNFIATRLTGDITTFHFTGMNQIMYVTHYHVTNNTNPSWTQIAKQSDLTNLSNSVVKSVNGIKPTNGNVTIDIPDVTLIGTILALLNDEVPEGYLPAEGAEISRTTYADLFNVIGTKFGEGDGSTTFNLPNLVDRFLEGDDTPGTLKEPGLPNITGSVTSSDPWIGATGASNSALYTTAGQGDWVDGKAWQTKTTGTYFDASRSSSIYGNSETVQPPAITVRFIIKY